MNTRLKLDPLYYEKELWKQGFSSIAGIDEVGRGPLAGPVYACAVIFNAAYFHHDVRDSKKITAKKRIELAKILSENASAWAIGQASVGEIDRLNIRQATFLAMKRAFESLQSHPDYLLVDGEKIPEIDLPMMGLVKGDEKSFTIGAASIIAKVARDTYMIKLNEEYPLYGFERNKGYGTAEHIRALQVHGASPHHRRSFLNKILEHGE
jgi:ribonuclease HII